MPFDPESLKPIFAQALTGHDVLDMHEVLTDPESLRFRCRHDLGYELRLHRHAPVQASGYPSRSDTRVLGKVIVALARVPRLDEAAKDRLVAIAAELDEVGLSAGSFADYLTGWRNAIQALTDYDGHTADELTARVEAARGRAAEDPDAANYRVGARVRLATPYEADYARFNGRPGTVVDLLTDSDEDGGDVDVIVQPDGEADHLHVWSEELQPLAAPPTCPACERPMPHVWIAQFAGEAWRVYPATYDPATGLHIADPAKRAALPWHDGQGKPTTTELRIARVTCSRCSTTQAWTQYPPHDDDDHVCVLAPPSAA